MPSSNSPDSRPPTSPPEAWAPLHRLAGLARRAFERFLQLEAAGGIALLVVAAVALVWANSPWALSYVHLWQTPLGFRLGAVRFERPLAWFVNDGVMVLFFFVVGLELRRELHQGELSEWRRAALPAAAALGGMAAPALVYLAIARAPATRSGWGVPMATDIAFAVGVLALLGRRVPAALRVLLLTLAVLDDLGAILVIALFYSTGIALSGVLVAALGLAIIVAMRALGVRSKLLYVLPAVVVWAGTYAAGVHPTIAGVVVGLLTPVRAWLGPEGFVRGVRGHGVNADLREATSPAEGLIETLRPWVAFLVMPLFALANAGVSLGGLSLDRGTATVALGVVAGLVVGKLIGVLLASALALRLGVATLPKGITARHLVVLGAVAGIGFTMALFIARLAFVDPPTLRAARLGVLAASAVAALLGLGLGRVLLREAP